MLRAMRPPGATRRRPRPVRAGLRRGRSRCPATGEEPGVDRRLDHRDVRRREALRRQLALGRHAVLRPRRQAARRSARRRSRSSSSARRTRRSRRRRPRACDRTCSLVHVQPDEGVSLAIGAKVPGQGMTIRTVHMDFLYGGAFRTELPEAYERLILDCLLGDATLFTRADEVDAQWALVDSIVARWKREQPAFPNYAAGHLGAARGRRADPAGRTRVATTLTDTSASRRSSVGSTRSASTRSPIAADERRSRTWPGCRPSGRAPPSA